MNFSLMNMYWNSVYTSSNINSLLEKEDTTLEDLLEQDDVVDECQRNNTALLQRLTQHENVSRMVDMMLSPPNPSLPDATKYKNAFKACEVLTCEAAVITNHFLDGLLIDDDQLFVGIQSSSSVSGKQEKDKDETGKTDCKKEDINLNEKDNDINKELFQEVKTNHDNTHDTPTTITEVITQNTHNIPATDQVADQPHSDKTEPSQHSNQHTPPHCPPLERLYIFLQQEPPINPLQSSFFTKTMILLFSRYSKQTISFLYSKPDLIELLISHIEVSSIADFLMHLLTSFHPSLPPSWDFNEVIKKMLIRLDPSFSRQIHSNISQCICEILKANREKMSKLEDLKQKKKVVNVQECDVSTDNSLENRTEKDSNNAETTFKSVLNDNNAVNNCNNNTTIEDTEKDEDNNNNSSTSDNTLDSNIIIGEGINKSTLPQNLHELNIDDDGFNSIYLSNDEEKEESYFENEEKEYVYRKDLVDVVCSENIVNTLLELLHQHHNDSTVINTITIFQGILSSDCKSLSALLDTVLSHLQTFLHLLHNPPSSLVTRESYPTLGSVRLSIIRFFNHLLSLDQVEEVTSIFIPLTSTPLPDFSTSVHHAFAQTQVLPVIMDLFYKFPYNNFLHTEVSCLIFHALEHPLKPHPVLKQLLSNCDFLQKTMDEINNNCCYNGKTNRAPRRPGYIGHLCKIANQLTSHEVVQGDHYADLLSEGTRRDWESFCGTTLATINRLNDTPLCTSGNNRTSDEEDEGSGEDASLDQNIFAEYCKQMSKDFQTQPVNTDFVETFTMTSSQLTPADKSTSDPLTDTLSLINFDLEAILKRERPSACIFDRALNPQFPILLSNSSAFSNDTSLSKDEGADGGMNDDDGEEKDDASNTDDSDGKDEFDSDFPKQPRFLQNHSPVPIDKTTDNDDDDYITITERNDDVKDNGIDVDGRKDVEIEARKTPLSKQLSGTPVDCSE